MFLHWNLMKQSILLCSNGFCTSMVYLWTSWAFFPPTEWLVAKVGPAALKTLVLKSIHALQTFCFFLQFEETDAWLVFVLFLSSLPFLPSQSLTILLSYFPVSVQLLQPCLIRQGNEEAHKAALRMHSFQLIACSWIVLLREFFPRWTLCPFTASFKNTFGCFKH